MARQRGFAAYRRSTWVTALVVVALSAGVALAIEGPWWKRVLAFLFSLGVYAACGWTALSIIDALFSGVFRRRKLRRVLRLVAQGKGAAARALLEPLAAEGNLSALFAADPTLLAGVAAAARRDGEARLPILRLLLRDAPESADVDAALDESRDVLEPADLKNWLFRQRLHRKTKDPASEARMERGE